MSTVSFDEQINKIINEWNHEFSDKAVRCFRDAAVFATALLKKTSPRQYGDYAEGWDWSSRSMLGGSRSRQRNGAYNIGEYVVYNATNWQLTHLLEKGHENPTAITGMKRTPAHPHIKPVEQEAVKKLIQELYDEL